MNFSLNFRPEQHYSAIKYEQ